MKRSFTGEQCNMQEMETWREGSGLDSKYVFVGNEPLLVQEPKMTGLLDDLKFEMFSPTLDVDAVAIQISELGQKESGIQGPADFKEKILHPSPLASLELLNEYGKGFKRLKLDTDGLPGFTECQIVEHRQLSTEEIMRIAGSRFISAVDTGFVLGGAYDISLSDLSDEDAKAVQLAELLLAAAEKVGERLFDCARNLLNHCDVTSSDEGTAVQRVIYYFSKALRERIDRESRKKMSMGFEKARQLDVDETLIVPNPCISDLLEKMPLYRPAELAGIQAIIESVGKAKKIHIIDLKIRHGAHWTLLIQALAAQKERRSVELLKITAVGTGSRNLLAGTGKRLMSFAHSMRIPFSFKIVKVSTWVDVKQDLFEVSPEEAVAVYSEYCLRNLIVQPKQVDSLMKVIRSINPRIMVVIEVEANHNSPCFVTRFIEILFYISVYFDCIDACMDRDDPSRRRMESFYQYEGIKNVLAAEGNDRKIRHVNMKVWRTYFSQFGMVETQLSASSLYQVDFVLQKFAAWKSCTLHMDGRSLLLGWKGTPLASLSTWKFFTKRFTRL